MDKVEAMEMAEKIVKENKNPGWGDLAGMASHDDMVAVIAALLKALREAENSRK